MKTVRLRLQRGIALGRSRATLYVASSAVAALCLPLMVAALAREPVDVVWTPIGIAIGLLTLAALLRPIEPAPGEKFSLAAAASLFGAIILPAPFAVGATIGAGLVAKVAQRRSALSTFVNVAQAGGATAAAALFAGAVPSPGVASVTGAALCYLAVTLASVGLMIVASQGPSAAAAFLAREWLPTSALLAVGGIAGIAWTRDPLAILLFIPVLAVVEVAVRRASRERAAQEEVTHMRRAQRDLAIDAAHELRSPLAALIGDLAYVREDRLPVDEAAALVAARDGSLRLRRTVDQLLALARVDASAARGERANLAAALRTAVADIALPDAVSLEVAIPPTLATALAPELATTLLRDLVGNAVAYTAAGMVCVAARADGGRVVLTVRDTGIGIAEAELARVFDRFYRGPRARSMAPGTGLGLAIVRRIVESCGGAIAIESAPDRGTTITVTLPAA